MLLLVDGRHFVLNSLAMTLWKLIFSVVLSFIHLFFALLTRNLFGISSDLPRCEYQGVLDIF